MDNYFITLNNIDVNDKTEKKGNLTYLSWAWAWAEVKKLFPDTTYKVYENEALGGMPYFTDGKTCMVKTGVTINGIEHIEYLPIMDFKNKSIPAEDITSMDVNKAVQRCLTKSVARHGLGLYIYAGEDLPEEKAKERDEQFKEDINKGRNLSLERKTKASTLAQMCNCKLSDITNRLIKEAKTLGHDLSDEEAISILDGWLLKVANDEHKQLET